MTLQALALATSVAGWRDWSKHDDDWLADMWSGCRDLGLTAVLKMAQPTSMMTRPSKAQKGTYCRCTVQLRAKQKPSHYHSFRREYSP